MPQIYKVGGCVRDKLLGVDSKDIDFTFVLDDLNQSVEDGFWSMYEWLTNERFQIFLSTPTMFTIRAKFPDNHIHSGLVADFVMARKEIGYIEGTRRPELVLGTLEDDLLRRDFTVNAMAEDEEGNIIDLFGGQEHLKEMLLITPRNCGITFNEDPLRILRAIRFAITRGFKLDHELLNAIKYYDYNKMSVVSTERIREELYKCFKHDTIKTLRYLDIVPSLKNYIFKNNVLWLKPTMEQ